MARTGSLFLVTLLLASPALAAEVEFYMTTDRAKVGTEDTFRVEIVVANAPQGATLRFPAPKDFEILGRSESTQMSFAAGAGGAGVITSVRKHTLTMRANRTGHLTIPPAVLDGPGKEYKTDSLSIDVVKGRLAPERTARPQPKNPFVPPGFPSGLDDEDPFEQPDVPASDSDLFVRARADKSEVVVGEQITYTLQIYARLDLSSVDSVKPPRLDGFFSADLKVPQTLMPEQQVIGGVPYREYLLRSRALFALKPGTIEIEPAEADITTGMFFAGRRVSRKSNPVTVKVKPLPPGGSGSLVGQWRMTREVSQTRIALGDPLQVKLRIEGKGNLQTMQVPPLKAPTAFKTFDPETKDSNEVKGNTLVGQRTIEYTLVPQQTGTFELPAMKLDFYDPAAKAWQIAEVAPVTITVTPSAVGASTSSGGAPLPGDPKNQLVGGGLKSLRYTAHFSPPGRAVSGQPWFLPVAIAPVALSLVFGLFALVRGAVGRETDESLKKKQAKAARKRLAAAQHLLVKGSPTQFYAEVERALTSFIEARLGTPLTGLTRPELAAKLEAAGVAEQERHRIATVFDTCDLGRYAPGMGEVAARRRSLDDAAAAMEGWE
jgi:BatD DUF11 like domain